MNTELEYDYINKARKRILSDGKVNWEEYAAFYRKAMSFKDVDLTSRALRIVGMDLIIAGVVGLRRGYEFHTDKGVISLPVTLPGVPNRFTRREDAEGFKEAMGLKGIVVPV